MTLKIFTPAAEEPITVEEARQYLRVTSTSENSLIQGLIIAAREHAETFTRRRFVTQTWESILDGFPAFCAEIPNAPLQSVTSITYIDTAGNPQILAPTEYEVDTKAAPGRIVPAYGKVWPPTRSQLNAVTIRFVCGYGAAAAVPFSIKVALQLLVQYFEQRDADEKLKDAAERVLSPFRAMRF
jgi:uncharacterized phiE125 gp8 family phage protein